MPYYFEYPTFSYLIPVRPSLPASDHPYSPPNPASQADVLIFIKTVNLAGQSIFVQGYQKFQNYNRFYRTVLYELLGTGTTQTTSSSGRLFCQASIDKVTGDRSYSGGGHYQEGPGQSPPPPQDPQIRFFDWTVDSDGTIHQHQSGYQQPPEGTDSTFPVDAVIGNADGILPIIDETHKYRIGNLVIAEQLTLSDLVDWDEVADGLAAALDASLLDTFPFGVGLFQIRAHVPITYGGTTGLQSTRDKLTQAQAALTTQQGSTNAAFQAFATAQSQVDTTKTAVATSAGSLIDANSERERAHAAVLTASTDSEKQAATQRLTAAFAAENAARDNYGNQSSAYRSALDAVANAFSNLMSAQRKLDDAERNFDYWGDVLDLAQTTITATAHASPTAGVWYHEASFNASATSAVASNDQLGANNQLVEIANRFIGLQINDNADSGSSVRVRTGRYFLRMRLPPQGLPGTTLGKVSPLSFWTARLAAQDFNFRWAEITKQLSSLPNTLFNFVAFGFDFDDQASLPANNTEWKLDSTEFSIVPPDGATNAQNQVFVGGPNSYGAAKVNAETIWRDGRKMGFAGYRVNDQAVQVFKSEAIKLPDGTLSTHHVDVDTQYEIWDNPDNFPDVPNYSQPFPGTPLTNPSKPTAESPSQWTWRDGSGASEKDTVFTLSDEDTTADLNARVSSVIDSAPLNPASFFGDVLDSGLVAGKYQSDDETYLFLAKGMVSASLDPFLPTDSDRTYTVMAEKITLDRDTLEISREDYPIAVLIKARQSFGASVKQPFDIPSSNQLIFFRLKQAPNDANHFFRSNAVCDPVPD